MKIELVNGNRISKWKWEKKEIVFPNDFFKRKKEKEKEISRIIFWEIK